MNIEIDCHDRDKIRELTIMLKEKDQRLKEKDQMIKERDQRLKERDQMIKEKENLIKELKDKLKPKKTIEECIKDLIYRFCLVHGSQYFRREVAARIMRAAVNQCKQIDTKWKSVKGSDIEELLVINSCKLNNYRETDVYKRTFS